jgi:hypothetical protein
VRQHISWASAILALALAAAGCGTAPGAAATSPASTCVNAGAPHHAYLVVQHLSGASVQKCVGFTGDTVDGAKLMDTSKIEYQAQTFSFGKAVCQVDNEQKTFTACFPQNQPYWALFVDTGGAWATAQNGYTQITLHDKEALGWHYSSDQNPTPPPLPKES